MNTPLADKRSVLKQGQIDILELIYKYRFVSRQLLAESLGIKSGSSLHERLGVLVKHGYIHKRLEPKLKLHGTPAAYYVTPKGLRFLQTLQDHTYITDAVLKGSYRDGTVSQSFVNHTLRVYALSNSLNGFYPALKVFMPRDMRQYPDFPDLLPDAFVSLKEGNKTLRFFLDVIPDNLPSKPLFQRITKYAEFFEDGGWDEMSAQYPTLLFIGETGATERRMRRIIKAALYKAELDQELTILTTTIPAIENIADEGQIWTSLDDTDELLALTEA